MDDIERVLKLNKNIPSFSKPSKCILNSKISKASKCKDAKFPKEDQKKEKEVINKPEDSISNSKILLYSTNNSSNSIINANPENSFEGASKSTNDNSKSYYSSIFNISIIEKKFNSLKSEFYMKFKLYDHPLFVNNFCIPEKYKITENYWAFLYPNNLITFPLTISGFLYKINRHFISNDIKEDNISIWNENLGLFFCGRIFKSEKEDLNKICRPNEFICATCIEKNRKKYNLGKYLININGRVAKINKGKYHCFGHFLIGCQIEDCITNFTCKACLMLNIQEKLI